MIPISYTTESIEDVVKEDNEDWRQISRLELIIDNEPNLKFTLQFSNKGCDLRATGADRDNVFLLLSDLRDYIEHEVATVTSIAGKNFGYLAVILITLVGLLVMTFSAPRPVDRNATNRILASSDLAAKLNFLIQQSDWNRSGDKIMRLFPIGMVIGFILIFGGDTFAKALFPANIFLFGKRRETYAKRKRFGNNILWIVIVGLIVSIIAGLIVWFHCCPGKLSR